MDFFDEKILVWYDIFRKELVGKMPAAQMELKISPGVWKAAHFATEKGAEGYDERQVLRRALSRAASCEKVGLLAAVGNASLSLRGITSSTLRPQSSPDFITHSSHDDIRKVQSSFLTSTKSLVLGLITAEKSSNLRSGKTFFTFWPEYCPQMPYTSLKVGIFSAVTP